MLIYKQPLNFDNIIGKLVTFRNGEKLLVTDHKYFPETNYGLCHALMFGSVSRYMLFNKYGNKSEDRASPQDIINIEGISNEI